MIAPHLEARTPAPILVIQDDDEEEKPDKRPEVKELLGRLKEHASKRGKEDQDRSGSSRLKGAALAAALWSIDPGLFRLPNVGGDDQDPLSLPGSVLRLEGWLYAPIGTGLTGAVAATPPSQ